MNVAASAASTLIFLWLASTPIVKATAEAVSFHPLVTTITLGSSLKHLPQMLMRVRKGIYPNVSSDATSVEVGQPITLSLDVHSEHTVDVVLDGCWAYNDPNYQESTSKLVMTSNRSEYEEQNGTALLINPWKRTRHENMLQLYTNTTAFKFPERDQVYINCAIKICDEPCKAQDRQKKQVPPYHHTIVSAIYQPFSIRNKFLFIKHTTTPKYQTTTEVPDVDCDLNSKHSACQSKPPKPCYPGSQDPECSATIIGPDHPTPPPSSPPLCYPGSTDPQCYKPISLCHPGSNNIKCSGTTKPCFPDSTAPHCNYPQPPFCYPGSADPRCQSPPPPICYPGSQHPSCIHLLPNDEGCHPGSQDPNCIVPPVCYPGSQNPLCSSGIPSICYPGSRHPHCKPVEPVQCYPDSKCLPKPPPPLCYPGSQQIHCTLNSRPTKIVCFFKAICYPRVINPQDLQVAANECADLDDPACSENSRSLRMPSSPLFREVLYNPFLPPNCYPKSKDPRCNEMRKKKTGSDVPTCYPGSQDPRCSELLKKIIVK